jgi:hypothetical protein
MANPKNRFASAKTFAELEDMFEYATSPENLYADGERSRAEAQTLHNHLLYDYTERDEELVQEHNNGLMR